MIIAPQNIDLDPVSRVLSGISKSVDRHSAPSYELMDVIVASAAYTLFTGASRTV